MKILCTYLSIVILLGLAGCGKQSNTTVIEKAEHLARRAAEEAAAKQHANAERLLQESIELISSTHNNEKLTELYGSLASIQLQSGKLLPTLQSLTMLRNLYQQANDRNAELNTMLEIGRVNFRLGRIQQAIAVLDETYLSSQLFNMHVHFGKSAHELAKIYAATNRHHQASPLFSEASAQFLQLNDTANVLYAIAENIGSLLATGAVREAAQYVEQFQQIAAHASEQVNVSAAYVRCGMMFMAANEYELANGCFNKALALANNSNRTVEEENSMNALIALAELHYNNYGVQQAQQELSKAYSMATQRNNRILEACLLIRMADCEIKKEPVQRSAERALRAIQLLENAQALFVRCGFGLGEAYVMHRLGMVKEYAGDDNSALTYYKRAFEKFSDNNLNVNILNLPVNAQWFHSSADKRLSPEQWFTNRLTALLLKYKKFNEALDIIERSRSLSLQKKIAPIHIQFQKKEKQQLVNEYFSAATTKEEYQLELFHFLNANKNERAADQEYAAYLQQKIAQQRNSLISATEQLTLRYPALKIFAQNTKATSTAAQFLPPSTAIARYYFVENEAWAFIIPQGNEVSAVKISSFRFELEKKMRKMMSLIFSSNNTQTLALAQLSRELYALLIQPVEQFGQQRFIIVPPDGLEKFPFHVLQKEGKPLIELIEVSYLPSILLLQERKPLPQFITNIVGIGFSQDSRWGLEFELRDIRSFFRNAQVLVNQAATTQRLTTTSGEILQLSSTFQKNEHNEFTVTLSDGSSSLIGANAPISIFTSCHPFYVVYLADVQTTRNTIATEHSLLWMLNGTAAVIATEFPLTQRMSRTFGENFYSSLSAHFLPYNSYRQAMLQLAAQKEFSDNLRFASYFFYGF